MLCSVDPSHGRVYARGWCRRCYHRWQMRPKDRRGDPGVSLRTPRPLADRLHYTVDKKSGCWIWSRAISKVGYGWVLNPDTGMMMPAHRAVYTVLVGPIPDGFELDHLCANRACVNPDHLEPVTHAENRKRGGKPHFEMS